ncbi:MAG TPA: DNA-formamidopyrimidine glycosylase family protein [Gemmatimonadaceae bacterium]|nr:DNA-formamidopyrimidine glycosylase family protein [Gemmatimonadaceae bacterium]
MPELPDILAYIEALTPRVMGKPIEGVRLLSPFVLRTVEPPFSDVQGKHVRALDRLGKRIVFALDDELYLVIHLMIAGRLRWRARDGKLFGRITLAAFDFPEGTLALTEAGSKRRASIHLVRGSAALEPFRRGGLNVLEISEDQFAERLRSESHTLKRALTDPRLFDGIGNAYSDEILHRARLSPLQLTRRLDDEGVSRLFASVQSTLGEWIDRLKAEARTHFPEKVTAFREGMAVHGRYQKPCPVCGTPVQRIRYADNETNYCARCQTEGRLLADRAMSRLLKQDWPRTLEELEA